jgi:hypothetical protein
MVLFLALLVVIGTTTSFVPGFVPATNRISFLAELKRQNTATYNEPSQISTGVRNWMQPLRAIETTETEIDMDADIEYTKGMPDKSDYSLFYRKTVSFGAEMTLKQFVGYSSVEQLLLDGLIVQEDVDDLWQSAVGDAQGLNEEEGYEMLCMVLDLPDPEDIKYLDEEFNKLVGKKTTLNFMKFLSMADVQDMMEDDALTMEDVTQIWIEVAGGLNKDIDRKLFGKLNNALDDFIDMKEEAEAAEEEQEEEVC